MREARAQVVPQDDATVPADVAARMVELLFFAYRDFIGEPDRILGRYGFGRAHHRVLHFVNGTPGLTVAALLDILGITKQSLSRVLRDLVEGGFILQQTGAQDRRQRLLYVTASGKTLAEELLGLQQARITRALEGLAPAERAATARFLFDLIDTPAGEAGQHIQRLAAPAGKGQG